MNRPVLAVFLASLGCVSCIELGVQNQSSSASSGVGGSGGVGGGGAGGAIDSGGAGGVAEPTFCSNDPTLIACFPFDDDLGDKSPVANVVMPVDVKLSPGIDGNAADFGLSSQLLIPDSPAWNITQYTLELWYKQRSYSPTRMGLLDSGGRFGLFVYGSGGLRCTRSPQSILEKPGMPLDTWIHVACTFDGSKLRLFINGVLEGEIDGPSISGADVITIGSNSPSGESFDGLIDRVRVWNNVRTFSDICLAAGGSSC